MPKSKIKLNKLYTRSGDSGDTALVGGEKVRKDHPRVEAYGDLDELNSFIGLVRTYYAEEKQSTLSERLALIQKELFDIGAELATPPQSEWPGMQRVGAEQITRLENWIDEATTNLQELRSFVLPGGSEGNARLHLARVVCRRVERRFWLLTRSEKMRVEIGTYLNRLSDLLFAWARLDCQRSGAAEYLWKE